MLSNLKKIKRRCDGEDVLSIEIPDGIILNPVIICIFTCKYGLGIYIVILRIIGLIIAKAGWV